MFRPKSKLGFGGFIITIMYFAAIVVAICFTDWFKFKQLDLNELGDFLAGVFGPPALIWVVISFYLQSAELRNSVDALKLQADELAKSVEQQIAMVDLTREIITHEKVKFVSEEETRRANMKPKFSIRLLKKIGDQLSRTAVFSMEVRNIGGAATDTHFNFRGFLGPNGSPNFQSVWNKDEEHSYGVRFRGGETSAPDTTIVISYKDSESKSGEQFFEIDNFGRSREITSP